MLIYLNRRSLINFVKLRVFSVHLAARLLVALVSSEPLTSYYTAF